MTIHLALLGAEQHAEFVEPLRTAFGLRVDAERVERAKRLTEHCQRIVAKDGDKLVGAAGAFRFEMTTPGGSAPVSGLTMVGVMPTHRRRGILSRMMRMHIDLARENGQ